MTSLRCVPQPKPPCVHAHQCVDLPPVSFRVPSQLFSVLGGMLWRGVKGSDTVGVAEQLLTVLQDALPDDATSLRGFYPVLEAAEAFEQQLYSRKLLSDSDHVLSSFAKDADAHFAYKKRRQVLAQARRLVRAAVCAPRGTRPTHTPLAIALTPQLVCLLHRSSLPSTTIPSPWWTALRCAA